MSHNLDSYHLFLPLIFKETVGTAGSQKLRSKFNKESKGEMQPPHRPGAAVQCVKVKLSVALPSPVAMSRWMQQQKVACRASGWGGVVWSPEPCSGSCRWGVLQEETRVDMDGFRASDWILFECLPWCADEVLWILCALQDAAAAL